MVFILSFRWFKRALQLRKTVGGVGTECMYLGVREVVKKVGLYEVRWERK